MERPRATTITRSSKGITLVILGLLVTTLLVVASARPPVQPTTRHSIGSTQMAFFGYWSEKPGFNSAVIINNASNTTLNVTPVLYDLNGKSVEVSPISLGARQEITVNVLEWLTQSGAGAEINEGSMVLTYDAPDAAYLGAQVVVTQPTLGQSFDFRDEMPMSFKSSRLEGLWWNPDSDSRYDLIVSNMEGANVTAVVKASGGQGLSEEFSFNLQLTPHQTQILSLEEMKLPFTTSPSVGKVGGISITHDGVPGSVIACGILRKAGFSSHFPFEDPADGVSQTLTGAHLLIDKPDIPGFAAHTSFTSIALLRNTSHAAVEVLPTVSFLLNGQPQSVPLAKRTLSPIEPEALDVGAELKRSGIRGSVTGCGLTLTSSGQPGDIVAHVTSFDQTRSHVFDVPMKDPGIAMNRHSGSYPWNLSDDSKSIIHVRNTADVNAKCTIQLDFTGGSYTLPMKELEPQQEIAVDIRQLRDSQAKDSVGRVIPLAITHGQATWSERGRQALIGRTEVFSASKGVSSSFSCGGPCCPPNTESIYASPESLTGPAGHSGAAQAFEMQRRACDGAQFGPFEISSDVTWASTNTQVVTMNGTEINCVAVGDADVNISFQGTQWLGSELNQVCEFNAPSFFFQVPVQVFGFFVTLNSFVLTPLGTGGTSSTTVTVITTPPVANQHLSLFPGEVVDSGGHVSHTGSRQLGTFAATQGATGADGRFQTTYTAPIFGGDVVVLARFGTQDQGAAVQVLVSGLSSLGAGQEYDLVGATGTHPDNHYGIAAALNGLPSIASDYKTQYYGQNQIPNADKLKYNDMSLINGGKFDIDGNWCTSCGHAEHRVGINCDVFSSNVPTNRWAALTQIFAQRGSPNYLDETATLNHWHLRFQ